MKKIVALTGNLSRPSRTRALAEVLAQRIAQQVPAQVEIIDISYLAVDLGHATSFNSIPASITRAHQQIEDADLIVLASPVYKASYSGLFKHFLDLLDPAALRGKVAVLAATGGSDRHALVIDHQLRPLASFFETVTVPAGVYVKDADFVNYALQLDKQEEVRKRIDLVVGQAAGLLEQKAELALAA